jgi:polyhydroxyalkanoate synthesis regulator phasin
MEDALKKFLYAGIELAAETQNKLNTSVTKLMEKGKISEADGRKLVDDIIDKSKKKQEELEKKTKSFIEKFDKNKAEELELERLKKKVSDLESKLKEKEKAAKA